MRMCLFLCILCIAACAPKSNTVSIEHAYWVEPAPTAKVFAAYATIQNPTDAPITLVELASAAFADVQLHETSMNDGMMQMRERKTLQIAANSTLEFTPGGLHLMLMQPTESFAASKDVPLSFVFQQADGAFITLDVSMHSHDIAGESHAHDEHEHEHEH